MSEHLPIHPVVSDSVKDWMEQEAEIEQLKAQLAQVTADRDKWKDAHASLTMEVAEWEDEHTRIYAVLYPNGVTGGVDRHGQPIDPPETDECIRQLKTRAEKAEAERDRLIERQIGFVDTNLATFVTQKHSPTTLWYIWRDEGFAPQHETWGYHHTKEEAIAAVRAAAGLDATSEEASK